MTHKIPPFIPLSSNMIEDKRIKRLNKEIPNCSGLGILMGLYFHLIKEDQLKCAYEDIDIIADELRTSIPLITTVIESYNLFHITEDSTGKKFFSVTLNKALEPYFAKCETNRINAKIGATKRKIKQKQQIEQLKQLSQCNSSERTLNECSANIIEENRIQYNIIEKKDFSKFKEEVIKKYRNKELLNNAPNFIEDTIISLNSNGLLINSKTNKIITKEEAYVVWNYLFQNKEKVGVIEKISPVKKFINEKIIVEKLVESRGAKDKFIYKIIDIFQEKENQFRMVLKDIYDNKVEKAKTLLTYEQLESYINQNKYEEKEY